jgi:hypothetical protein
MPAAGMLRPGNATAAAPPSSDGPKNDTEFNGDEDQQDRDEQGGDGRETGRLNERCKGHERDRDQGTRNEMEGDQLRSRQLFDEVGWIRSDLIGPRPFWSDMVLSDLVKSHNGCLLLSSIVAAAKGDVGQWWSRDSPDQRHHAADHDQVAQVRHDQQGRRQGVRQGRED